MRIKILLTFFLSIYGSLLLFGQDNNHSHPGNLIPIEYRRHIYIKGSVKGAGGNFVFDTGADHLYLDSLFYHKNNFTYDSIERAKIPGVGKDLQNVKVIMNSVRFDFGGLPYQTKAVPVLNLKSILGDFADGILGLNYFSDKILEISYPQRFLRIHDQMDSIQTAEYTKIQCQVLADRLYIPLTLNINDNVSITDNFLLDLGCGSTIVLTSPVALKYNLNRAISHKVKNYSKYRGVGGASESYAFIAKSMEIGGYELRQFEADYSTDPDGSLASTKHAGLLGNKILDRFDVLMDFRNHCLYIKPNSTFSDTFQFSTLGFSFIDQRETLGALIVSGFFENSQAEKSGLLMEDKIIAINHIPVTELDYQKREEYLNKTKILLLTIERGTGLLNIEIIQNQILRNDEAP